MGADGHVKIYDAIKLLTIIQRPQARKYSIFGIEVYVTYWETENQNLTNDCLVCGGACLHTRSPDPEHIRLMDEADRVAIIADWEVWN